MNGNGMNQNNGQNNNGNMQPLGNFVDASMVNNNGYNNQGFNNGNNFNQTYNQDSSLTYNNQYNGYSNGQVDNGQYNSQQMYSNQQGYYGNQQVYGNVGNSYNQGGNPTFSANTYVADPSMTGMGIGVKPPVKGGTGWLVVLMSILFIAVGLATVYISGIESQVVCSKKITDHGVVIDYQDLYSFKNDLLKKEEIRLSINIEDTFRFNIDEYVSLALKGFNNYKEAGYEIKVDKKKQSAVINFAGDVEDIMNAYNVELFSNLSADVFTANLEDQQFTCKEA